LAKRREPVALGEIVKLCNLKPSTVHRLLATLVAEGFASQDASTGKYKLGLKTFQIGNAALYNLDLRSVARPHLLTLVQNTAETANLVVCDRTNPMPDLIYIDQIESPRMIRTIAGIGNRVPIHSTGSGKVILAYMEEKELQGVLKRLHLERYTDKTIVDKDQLLKHIQQVRQQGFGVDMEETEPGVTCIAAPIWNHDREIVGTVSISGPTNRMELSSGRLVDITKATGLKVSRDLGCNIEL